MAARLGRVLELATQELSITTFRYVPADLAGRSGDPGAEAHLDKLNRVLLDTLQKLQAKGNTLMVVEHDMGFVGSIADHVTVLHQGSVLAEGSLEQVQENERVIEVYLGH